MTQSEQDSSASPLFSIVIPVYNDWVPLYPCLQSLARQTNAPPFEVILVDDGSVEAAPEFIRTSSHSYPLTLIRQSHSGIPSARNQGIRASRGGVLLFIDADCRLQTNCLAALSSTIAAFARARLLSAPARGELLQSGGQSRRTAAHHLSRAHASARRTHSILEYGWIRHATHPGGYRHGSVRSSRAQS